MANKHQQSHQPTIFYETDYIQFEKKKNRSGQFQTQDLWRPRRIHYLQTKSAEDAQKFEFIVNQDTK